MVRQVKNGQADEKSPYASCSEYVSIDAGRVWKLEVPYWHLKLEIAICDIKFRLGRPAASADTGGGSGREEIECLVKEVSALSKPAYKGVVKGRTVVLEKVADLPDGAEVLVTPLEAEKGSPQAILAAMDAPPHVKPGDVDELMRLIEKGKRPIRYGSPLTPKRRP